MMRRDDQTGQLIEYLSVRELVTMMAAIYRLPSTVEEGAFGSRGAEDFAERQLESSPGVRPNVFDSLSRWSRMPNS